MRTKVKVAGNENIFPAHIHPERIDSRHTKTRTIFGLFYTIISSNTIHQRKRVIFIYTSLFIVKHDSKKGKSETIRLQGYSAHIR